MEEIQEIKEKELKTIKILVKDIETKDGKKFKKYSMVGENGKLVDLRFKMGTDLSKLNECKKAVIKVAYLSDASDYYEFPRFYAGEITSVEKLS